MGMGRGERREAAEGRAKAGGARGRGNYPPFLTHRKKGPKHGGMPNFTIGERLRKKIRREVLQRGVDRPKCPPMRRGELRPQQVSLHPLTCPAPTAKNVTSKRGAENARKSRGKRERNDPSPHPGCQGGGERMRHHRREQMASFGPLAGSSSKVRTNSELVLR